MLMDFLLGVVINNVPGIKLPFKYAFLLCPPTLFVWHIVLKLDRILEHRCSHERAGSNLFEGCL